MDNDFVRSGPFIQELFGFSPLRVVDDIINSVNAIASNSIAAVESFVTKTESKLDGPQETNRYQGELESGMSKLRKLLQDSVDECFDKFEVYAMRNIFNIPADLIKEGWIRLPDQEGIDFTNPDSCLELEDKITRAREEYVDAGIELRQRKQLLAQLDSIFEELSKISAAVGPLDAEALDKIQNLKVQADELSTLLEC